MEYQFRKDNRAKPIAIFTMGAEAFSYWFEVELSENHQAIQHLLETIEQLIQKTRTDYTYKGQEYTLYLDQEEVEITAHQLLNREEQALPEGTELYNQELQSGCGLADFKQVVEAWQAFIPPDPLLK